MRVVWWARGLEPNRGVCLTNDDSTPPRRYIFPGLAMGALLARGNIVTDNMLMAVSVCLMSHG